MTSRRELRSTLEDIKADSSIRVLIVIGASDKYFVSSSDLADLKELSPLDMYNSMITVGQQLYTDFDSLDMPVVAMVNGLGTEFALACYLRIASEDARFGQPEISLGFIPVGEGTQRLARLIGIRKAKELIYVGAAIAPETMELFHKYGVSLKNVYGATACGVIALHRDEDIRYETVGKILDGGRRKRQTLRISIDKYRL